MPHTVSKTVFEFEELSDSAKETARDWFREGALDYDWWEYIYEDAATIAEMMGIELATKPVKLMGGGTRQDPCIYFSGFARQGDGACFEGYYSYAKGSAKAVKSHAPQDEELHRIVKGLQECQRRAFYTLTASIRQTGHYSHSRSMTVNAESERGDCDEATLYELLVDFADWIYKRLDAEHDYRMSDEAVDEDIQANEYEFEEDGSRA